MEVLICGAIWTGLTVAPRGGVLQATHRTSGWTCEETARDHRQANQAPASASAHTAAAERASLRPGRRRLRFRAADARGVRAPARRSRRVGRLDGRMRLDRSAARFTGLPGSESGFLISVPSTFSPSITPRSSACSGDRLLY